MQNFKKDENKKMLCHTTNTNSQNEIWQTAAVEEL